GPHGSSLCPAGHGPLRNSRDRARFLCFLQHQGRGRRSGRRHSQGQGGVRLGMDSGGMDSLGNLYQEVILDHSRRPRNFRKIEGASRKAEGYNPLCGDRVTIYLQMEGDVVKDASFQGSGCAISTSSASILTESMKGKTRAEAEALFETFHDLVTGEHSP